MTFATWDAGNLRNCTLDGTSLVATATSFGAGAVGQGTHGTGKFYWEVTVNVWGSGNTSVGICTNQINLGSFNAAGAADVLVYKTGSVFVANSSVGNVVLGARASGDTIGVALDLDAALIWFRVAPSGNWNGSASADPATGAGGYSIAPVGRGPATNWYPLAGLGQSGDQQTANFGASAFSGTAPSGFTAGWDTATPPVYGVTTQAGYEAWLTGQGTVNTTQVGYEAWFSIVPQLITTQVGYEAWFPVGSARRPKRRLLVLPGS